MANRQSLKTIAWTPEMLKKLKAAHKRALKKNGRHSVFVFQGNKYLVAYAGYLIEYLEGEFKKG